MPRYPPAASTTSTKGKGRSANASLRLIMPSAYGDRRKLTTAIHRHYLDVFRDREARVLVRHA